MKHQNRIAAFLLAVALLLNPFDLSVYAENGTAAEPVVQETQIETTEVSDSGGTEVAQKTEDKAKETKPEVTRLLQELQTIPM